jgi:hypothetical protein
VLQVMNNDFGDNLHDRLFTLDNGELREVPGPAAGRPSRWGVHQIVETVPGLAHSYFIAAVRQVRWASDVRQFYSGSTAGADLTYRLWERIFEVCRREGWPLAVLAVDLQKDRLRRLTEMTTAHGVTLIVPPPPSERPDLYFRVDGHWNEKGNREVARLLLNAIDRDGALARR